MDQLVLFCGKLHPLVLHAPIGAFAALGALELFAAVNGRQLAGRRGLAVFAALTGVASAATGWWLAADGYGGETLFRHRWSGVSFSVLLAVVALVARAERSRLYVSALVLAGVGAVLAGHFGATITHGPGYFSLPAAASTAPPQDPGPAPDEAPNQVSDPDPSEAAEVTQVQPAGPGWNEASAVLGTYCVSCHGPAKQKARLALHNPIAVVAGGFTGPVLIPGDAEASELLRRMRLPLEDDEHMPPTNKPQPSPEELALLESWVDAGAPGLLPDSPGVPPDPGAGQEPVDAPAEESTSKAEPQPDAGPAPSTSLAVGEPDPAALDALLAARLHVESFPLEDGAAGLWIDARPRADLAPDQLVELIAPLAPALVELSLAGTAIGDEHLAALMPLPRLERLDLGHTPIGSTGLAALARSERLRWLNLGGTGVDSLAPLEALPSLERVLLHGAPAAAVEAPPALRDLLALGGPNEPLEQEPVPVFGDGTSDPAETAAAPVNATCPVSGSPVDPAHTLLWSDEGGGERVVGFCCAQCPTTFRADPASFAVVD